MARTLEQIRRERGITKDALIRRSGLTKPTVYAALRGTPVSLETRVRLADALGIKLADVDPAGAELVAKVS